MSVSQTSTITLGEWQAIDTAITEHLNLKYLPVIYVLSAHLPLEQVHKIEEQLTDAGAKLTYDISEAKLVLGAIISPKRAKFELQHRKLWTTPLSPNGNKTQTRRLIESDYGPSRKRRKVSAESGKSAERTVRTEGEDSTTASETECADEPEKPMSQLSISNDPVGLADMSSNLLQSSDDLLQLQSSGDTVVVMKLEWLEDSLKARQAQKLKPYVVYEGRIVAHETEGHNKTSQVLTETSPRKLPNAETAAQNLHLGTKAFPDPTKQAPAKESTPVTRYTRRDYTKEVMRRDFKGRTFTSSSQLSNKRFRPVPLLHETTSEHEENPEHPLPDMPRWVKENKIYACERSTPLHSPNDDFIDALQKIKLARILTLDEIGVRAYSTSIASLAAYPRKLTSPREVLALPGCDQKISNLFHQWQTSDGHLRAVEDIENDPILTTLRSFYNIWGVGAKTAREFYYDKGWRDTDGIIEQGWESLHRVQQIGLKYLDEFELQIPRSEVEFIASVVTYHAKKVIDDGIECIIVGGYRRGKSESGDVDLILSHRKESATKDLIQPVVNALEASGWITHSLKINETNSKRDQQPLLNRARDVAGGGFDTLDKAFVVWQDPNWPTKAEDLAKDPKAKNPNVHRRVDIIVSPWRTVGCAVAGWTSGTTFQRDLRRYAKHEKGWKFDSSGVRQRGTGKWIDLERWSNEKTRAKTWQEAERRVFEGLGLEYREPTERCTG